MHSYLKLLGPKELMEDSFMFRGKVPDDKHRLKIWLNGKLM